VHSGKRIGQYLIHSLNGRTPHADKNGYVATLLIVFASGKRSKHFISKCAMCVGIPFLVSRIDRFDMILGVRHYDILSTAFEIPWPSSSTVSTPCAYQSLAQKFNYAFSAKIS
jgi:hypothetical protein